MAFFVPRGSAPDIASLASKFVIFVRLDGSLSGVHKVLPFSKRAKDNVQVNYHGVPVAVGLANIVAVLDAAEQGPAALEIFENLEDEVVARLDGVSGDVAAIEAARDREIAEITAKYQEEIDEIEARKAEIEDEVLKAAAAQLPVVKVEETATTVPAAAAA